MSEDAKESEIKVTDKRRYRGGADTPADAEPAAKVEPSHEVPPDAGAGSAASDPEHAHDHEHAHGSGPLPELNFMSLIFSLASSAMMAMGDLADPDGKSHKDLPMAKQTIDLIGLLSEKTKGNLTEEEEQFLSFTLRDLRLRFVQARG